jgi:hypothetical protein
MAFYRWCDCGLRNKLVYCVKDFFNAMLCIKHIIPLEPAALLCYTISILLDEVSISDE